jgi:hypothetical protein
MVATHFRILIHVSRATKTTMTKRSPIEGLEYDWIAIDTDGYVALFSTAGAGHAPDEFLRDTEAHDAAIEVLLGLEPTTTVRFAPLIGPNRKNTWQSVAERGVFAFDSDPAGGPYRLVSAPVSPAHASTFPTVVRDAASAIVLEVRFREIGVVPELALKKSN